MSTFFLLPPRADVARRFSSYLQTWFPGLHPSAEELPEVLAATAERGGAFVAYADELPAGGGELDCALREVFGAEPRDRVIDLRAGPVGGDAPLATWMMAPRTPTRSNC